MADGKIRVKSEAEYTIEVNDNGDTIVFDLTDTSLASKMVKTFEKINDLTTKYQERAKEIGSQPDVALFDIPTNENDESGNPIKISVTQNQRDGYEMLENLYKESRETLDLFLGKGACQKIFGDKNYYAMFSDLTDQLKPHFEKMGLNAQNIKANAINKYSPNRESRRSLK